MGFWIPRWLWMNFWKWKLEMICWNSSSSKTRIVFMSWSQWTLVKGGFKIHCMHVFFSHKKETTNSDVAHEWCVLYLSPPHPLCICLFPCSWRYMLMFQRHKQGTRILKINAMPTKFLCSKFSLYCNNFIKKNTKSCVTFIHGKYTKEEKTKEHKSWAISQWRKRCDIDSSWLLHI